MLWSFKEENVSFCIRQVGEVFPFIRDEDIGK